jgi:hypothetical protein
MRDYDLWKDEPNPVFLILYEAATRRAYWLFVQPYFKAPGAPKPRVNAKTVRIEVPKVNKVRTAFFRTKTGTWALLRSSANTNRVPVSLPTVKRHTAPLRLGATDVGISTEAERLLGSAPSHEGSPEKCST